MTRSVLIVGGSGFLGSHLARKLREGYKVFATYHRTKIAIPGVTFVPFNVDNRNWVKRVIYTARPDVIVYVAGNHDVQWTEKNARLAERTHTVGAATVSNAADMLQPKFIYVSSAYLYDGARGNYHETDTPLPSSALGKVKMGGENHLRGKSLNYVVVRSSPIFGRSNGFNLSFLDKMRMMLNRGQRVDLAADELHSYAPVYGFTDFIARIVDTGIKNRVIHYGGLTKVSLYQFGRAFAERFGYDPGLVVPKPIPVRKSIHGLEEVLSDYSLNSTYAAENLKIKPLLLEEGLDLLEKGLVAGP